MTRREQGQQSMLRSLVQLWQLAPGKMRRLILLGAVFRMLQAFCLAAVFGVISLWGGAFAAGVDTSFQKIVATSVGVVVLLILQFLFAFCSVGCIWLTSFRLAGAIRLRLLRRLLDLPLTFHLSRSNGDLATALTGDLALVENLLTDGFPRLVHSVSLPLFVLLIIAVVDPVTALFATVPIVAALPLLLVSCRRLVRLSAEKQQAQADATSRVLQWSEGMETVRSFGMLDHQNAAFTAPLWELHRISVRMLVRLTVPLLGFSAVVTSGFALISAVVGYRHGLDLLSSAKLTSILTLALPLYAPLLGLAPFIEIAAVAQAAIGRLTAIISAAPEHPTSGSKPSGHAIACDAVSFSYSSTKQVFECVSFTLPECGLTAITGPSGAGKSTLLYLLAGLLPADQGRVLIGGVDIKDLSQADLDRLVSVVFQDVMVFSGSVRDTIAMGRPQATQADIEAAAKAAGAHAFINALPDGYDTRIGEAGMILSGGERQRLSLARAILKDTPIILVDEGTASVDNLTAKVMTSTLRDLAKHRSVIVVTHHFSLLEGVDQIVHVEKPSFAVQGWLPPNGGDEVSTEQASPSTTLVVCRETRHFS